MKPAGFKEPVRVADLFAQSCCDALIAMKYLKKFSVVFEDFSLDVFGSNDESFSSVSISNRR